MFGFGKNVFEKVMIDRVKKVLDPLGMGSNAVQMVEKSKKETLMLTDRLDDMTWGNKVVEVPGYVEQREKFGITKSDITEFWNKGVFIRVTDNELRNFINVINMEVMRKRESLEMLDAARAYFKNIPFYGPPDQSHPALPVGVTFIPQELADRVTAWEARVGEQEKKELMTEHTCYNSMLIFEPVTDSV